MPKVHITQCLCPKRHCIMALAWEEGQPTPGTGLTWRDSTEATAGLQALIEWFVKDGQINPWCGICHSRTFNYEDGLSGFNSMEEALPALKKIELENIVSRAKLDAISQQ